MSMPRVAPTHWHQKQKIASVQRGRYTFKHIRRWRRDGGCILSKKKHPLGIGSDKEKGRERVHLLSHTPDSRTSTMKTRLGCLSNKSDSYSDFSEFLPPAHETTARCLKLSTDEVVRWSESFDLLLSHKYGLAAFRAFLKTEFSDENIEFWMACEDYKKIKSSTKLVSKSSKIFKEFIDVQAPREVNIDCGTRERTKQSLEDPSPTSLNEIQAKVYSLMEKDSYPRFLRSKMYQDIVNRTHAQGQRRSV